MQPAKIETLCIYRDRHGVCHARDAADTRPIPHPLSIGWKSDAEATEGILNAFEAAKLPLPSRMTGRPDRMTLKVWGVTELRGNAARRQSPSKLRSNARFAAKLAALNNTLEESAAAPLPASEPPPVSAEPSTEPRTSPIPKEASARGGKARTAAKLNALAKVQAKKRDAVEKSRQALKVPNGFDSVPEFLHTIGELSGKRSGGRRELASIAGVDPSKITKWLKPNSNHWPTAPQIDKLAAWHASLRGDDTKPAPILHKGGAPIPAPAKSPIHRPVKPLPKLPDQINERLVKTARRRNVDPLIFLEQILDRHLPKLSDLNS